MPPSAIQTQPQPVTTTAIPELTNGAALSMILVCAISIVKTIVAMWQDRHRSELASDSMHLASLETLITQLVESNRALQEAMLAQLERQNNR